MPRPKKDAIVGGKDADLKQPSIPATSKSVTPVTPFLIQERLHQDIFEMYEAGVSPTNISRKYPVYSPAEILELCASSYSLDHIDENQLDGVLLKGMMRDLVRLDRYVRDHLEDAETALNGMKALFDARERTVKFRQLLAPKLSSGSESGIEAEAAMTWTIEQKLTTIIKRKGTEEAEKLISRLEKATQEELQDIIDAEFEAEELKSLPEHIEQTNFTPDRQKVHEEDLKTVIE